MNKYLANKYILWILLLIIISAFSYRQWKRSHQAISSNPFQLYQNDKISDSKNGMIVIHGQKFELEDLPIDVQKAILKEKQNFHEKQNAILKGFAVRYYAAHLNDASVSSNNVPDLMSFLKNSRPTQEQIDKAYEEKKTTFPANLSVQMAKRQVEFELLTQVALRFFNYHLQKLYEANLLQLPLSPPTFPLEWFDLKKFPKLGLPEAPNHLIVIANYVCNKCKRLNDELSALYSKLGPERLEITFVPYGNFSFPDSYLSRISMCVYEQDNDQFWKFHINLINLIKSDLSLTKDEKYERLSKLAIELTAKLNINHSNFLNCLSNQNKKLSDLFTKTNSDFSFLETNDLPLFILNNMKLDLEGRSLINAFEAATGNMRTTK